MTIKEMASLYETFCETMEYNKDLLTMLDQQSGDGDLGVSMCCGYRAATHSLKAFDGSDLGIALNQAATAFNEAAPSSLGTITAFVMRGMARQLKGQELAEIDQIAEALLNGIQNTMKKVGSKPGEKTIFDAIVPGANALRVYANEGQRVALFAAARAAAEGAEATKQMKAIWGRAAYYGDKTIGLVDGGAVVGKLLFEAAAKWVQTKDGASAHSDC